MKVYFKLDDNHDGDSGEHGRLRNALRFSNKLYAEGISYEYRLDTFSLEILRRAEGLEICEKKDVVAFMEREKTV